MDIVKHEGATPRPWGAGEFDDIDVGVPIIGLIEGVPDGGTPTNGLIAFATCFPTEMDQEDWTRAKANAALIVHAVNSIESLTAERDALREALEAIIDQDGAEINPSNYNHDDVIALNQNWIECFQIAEAALTRSQEA